MGPAVDDLVGLAERLRESHRKLGDEIFNLQALLGSLSEGVLIVDAAQRINLANDSLHRMFDLRMPWRDRTLMEVFRDHTLQEIILAALDDGTPQSRQLMLEVQQENRYMQKHFAITVAGLSPPDSDTTKGAIAIFHDITELKAWKRCGGILSPTSRTNCARRWLSSTATWRPCWMARWMTGKPRRSFLR